MEGADLFQGGELFALAHIQVDELVGLFHIQPAGNGGKHPDFGDCADKDVFGLAQGRVGHIALLQAAAAVGMQESLQPGGAASPDAVVECLFIVVGIVQHLFLLGGDVLFHMADGQAMDFFFGFPGKLFQERALLPVQAQMQEIQMLEK